MERLGEVGDETRGDAVAAAFPEAANDANFEGILGGVIWVDRVGEAPDEVDGLGVVRAREASRDNGGVTPAIWGFCAPLAKEASEVGFICDLLASDSRWRAERGTGGKVCSVGVSGVSGVPRNT